MTLVPENAVNRLSIIVGCLLAVNTAGAQTNFQGNAARTGVYPADGPLPGGTLLWAFTAGGAIVGSPVVADGTVYFGAGDGGVHAVA